MKQLSLFAKKAKRLVAVTATIATMLTSSIVAFGTVAEDDWTADMGACAVEDLFSAFNTGSVNQTQVDNAVVALNLAIQAFELARQPNVVVGCTCTFCPECLNTSWNRLNRMMYLIDFGGIVNNVSVDHITAIRQFNATGGFNPGVPQQNTRNNMPADEVKDVLTAIMRADHRSLTGQVVPVQ